MSDENVWSLQVSPKTPSGTLINIRGNSKEELANGLGVISDLAPNIVATEGLLTAASNASALTATPVQPAAPAVPPAVTVPEPAVVGGAEPPVTQPPAPATGGTPDPSCRHGLRVYKTGPNWKAWFCPTAKGAPDKCDPIWIRD